MPAQNAAADLDKPAQGKRSRKKRALGALAVLTVAGLVVVALYYVHSLSYVSTDDATVDGHMVAIGPRVAGHVVKVYVDDNQRVKKGDLLAELDPRDFEARLAGARAAYQVATARRAAAQINVDLTTVTSNAGLEEARAGVSLAESAVEAARVEVDVAQAQLAEAQAAVTVAQAVREQGVADVAAAEAQAQRDADDLRRYETLFKDHTVPQQQLDHARAAARASQASLQAVRKKSAASGAQVNQAQTAVTAAQGHLEAAGSKHAEAQSGVATAKARLAAAQAAPQQVAMSRAQVDVADAEVAQAQAALDQAQLDLSYTKITAPEAGRVTNKMVEEGAYVQVGQSLMTLVPARLWVVANFKETQLARIQPGQPVRIEVDAYPGKVFAGRVDSIQAGTGAVFSLLPPENATGYFVKVVQRVPVKIVFDEPPDLGVYHLGPGMSVVPTVEVAASGGAGTAARAVATGAAGQ